MINKISSCSLTSGIAPLVRHWTIYHRVVQGVGSIPPGDVHWNFFSDYFYLSFMLGQVDFSDAAILCNKSNNCCQQNLNPSCTKVFGTHTFYEPTPPMIPKTTDSTNFNFDRPLGLSVGGKKR